MALPAASSIASWKRLHAVAENSNFAPASLLGSPNRAALAKCRLYEACEPFISLNQRLNTHTLYTLSL